MNSVDRDTSRIDTGTIVVNFASNAIKIALIYGTLVSIYINLGSSSVDLGYVSVDLASN